MSAELKQVEALVGEARLFFAQRNPKKAAEKLQVAYLAARQAGLHREAAVVGRAMGILGSGGRPKLLGERGRLGEISTD